jgi:hypothetical protein
LVIGVLETHPVTPPDDADQAGRTSSSNSQCG